MALIQFKVGRTYILHDCDSSAHFRALVTKRTRCTVTFWLSDTGFRWCKTRTVTLRVVRSEQKLFGANDMQLEEVRGTSKGRFRRTLYSNAELGAISSLVSEYNELLNGECD